MAVDRLRPRLPLATRIYLAGIAVLLPSSAWMLLVADTEHVALWLVLPCAWVFGFFSVVTPLLTAYWIYRALRLARDPSALVERLRGVPDGALRERAIALLAGEMRVPRMLVRRLYERAEPRLRAALQSRTEPIADATAP